MPPIFGGTLGLIRQGWGKIKISNILSKSTSVCHIEVSFAEGLSTLRVPRSGGLTQLQAGTLHATTSQTCLGITLIFLNMWFYGVDQINTII